MPITHIAILDAKKEGVAYMAFNLDNAKQRNTFNDEFGFHEDALEDFPLIGEIREFINPVDDSRVLTSFNVRLLHNLSEKYLERTVVGVFPE